jgi:hypothetical protein
MTLDPILILLSSLSFGACSCYLRKFCHAVKVNASLVHCVHTLDILNTSEPRSRHPPAPDTVTVTTPVSGEEPGDADGEVIAL